MPQSPESPSLEQAKMPTAIIPEQLAVDRLEQPDPKLPLKPPVVGHLALLDFQRVLQQAEQLLNQRSLKPTPSQGL